MGHIDFGEGKRPELLQLIAASNLQENDTEAIPRLSSLSNHMLATDIITSDTTVLIACFAASCSGVSSSTKGFTSSSMLILSWYSPSPR